MSTQYTPGPWKLSQKYGHPWIVEAKSNIPDLPCTIVEVGYKPNAQLIAAAPELLEALEMARQGLKWYQDRFPEVVDGSDDEALEQIDAAVAKAKGE